MATSDAPVTVSRVALTVRDLDAVGDFYQSVIGLDPITRNGEALVLGQADLPLIELRRDPKAQSHPREAGLFHTAFLLPTRQDLGRWLRFAADRGIRLDGAGDHLVSEALYLADPEGNGIEIYADRPRDVWETDGTTVRMDKLAMNLNELASAPGEWTGMPDGSVIGHVHLQVGDIPQAEAFYAGELGLDLSSRLGSASFYATGGYHHHLATNIWNSRGAGPRSEGTAGLAELVLEADPGRLGAAGFTDPWGNRITVLPKPVAA